MKLATVLGTRPEIIKLSPLLPLLDQLGEHVVIHSGQHYSYEMDGVLFEDLRLLPPRYALRAGSQSHGQQTARILARLERVLLRERPALLVVQGDTNTTLAGALAGAKLGIRVVHVEAGCRSFSRQMPEELNRILVDHCSDLLFAPTEEAVRNLRAEGIPSERIHLVGSTALDACMRNLPLAAERAIVAELGQAEGRYGVVTIHRAENTRPAALAELVTALREISRRLPLVFPVHVRTAPLIAPYRDQLPQVRFIPPLGYLDMLQLVRNALAVLTDSGGLQEEAAALGVPLFVLREETEWEYLVRSGQAVLAGTQTERIVATVVAGLQPERLEAMRETPPAHAPGAAARIAAILRSTLDELDEEQRRARGARAAERGRQPRLRRPGWRPHLAAARAGV